MNMISVFSSNISEIGYESTTLYVRFNNGHLYAYYNVPYSVYQSFVSATSVGKFFEHFIKNTYQFQKLS